MDSKQNRSMPLTGWLTQGGLLERTRRLFLVFALVSLLLVLPGGLQGPAGAQVVMLASVLVCAVSWTWVHRHERSTWWCEVADVVSIAAYTAATSRPQAVLGFLFWAVWFRSMYGGTRSTVVRALAYLAATSAGIAVWRLLPGHDGSEDPDVLVGAFPLLLLSLAVVRRLYCGVTGVARALQRETVLNALSADLVGEVDRSRVLEAGWRAAEGLTATTPGLRLALVRVRDGGAVVEARAGTWARALRAGHLRGRPVETLLTDDVLNAAAGTTAQWTWFPSPVPGDEAWLLAGGEGLGIEAFESARLLTNQVALALARCAAHATLVERASVDSLTGLANRATFRDAVDLLLLDEQQADFTVLFIDLDEFKYVNDAYGHRAGDEVLRVAAQRLRDCVRGDDLCARLGGDEFAILLRDSRIELAENIADRIVEALNRPVDVASGMTTGEVRVGSSIGIAGSAGVVSGVDELVQRADVAMYSAKTDGGGVGVFGRRSAAAEAEAVLLRELAAATGRGQLEVHYQPVVDLTADPENPSCSGMEALVRWNHPERGLLGPYEFIARAERTGAIHEIGAFVLAQACRDAAAWTVAGRPLTVHVNVSVAQLSDDRLLGVVRDCLAATGLPPQQLVLEITESMVLEAPDALQRVHELAAHGVQIAVDDFGTGYASLTALRHLPVSVVKVDRSFVAGALDNPADLAIIEAVVQMADRLGLEVVAEGVEEVEQAKLLRAAGAHHAQGYLYSPPLPRVRFDEWLATHTPNRSCPNRRTTSPRLTD